MTTTCEALANQFAAAFGGLRDVITKVPDDQWWVGETRDQVPARRALHALAAACHHCRVAEGAPRRVRDDEPVSAYPSREEMLAHVDEIARHVADTLRGTTDDDLLASTRRFATALEYWLYALRHIQHHVGQLSSTLRERRLRSMKWH
jgi:hypothetical protein